MHMLAVRHPASARRGSNPVEETAGAALGGLEEYFKSHADPEARLEAIQNLIRSQDWAPVPETPLVPMPSSPSGV
jgi:hypothetical protein